MQLTKLYSKKMKLKRNISGSEINFGDKNFSGLGFT